MRSVIETDRTWTDNGNFAVDCDLRNPLQNAECAQISNLNFGHNNPNALVYADELTTTLTHHFETTAQIQRQLAQGLSLTAGYYRRDFKNFTVNDNTFVTPSDYTHYCVPEPVDDRLPGGGGGQICDLYDVSQAKFGQTAIVVRPDTDFGKGTQTYNGVDVTLQARLKWRHVHRWPEHRQADDQHVLRRRLAWGHPFLEQHDAHTAVLHVHGFRAVTVGHGDWHCLSGSARTQHYRDPQLHER